MREAVSEQIQVSNAPEMFVEDQKEDPPKQTEAVKKETKVKEDEFLAVALDQAVQIGLNLTIMQKKEKLTLEEVNSTDFGKNTVVLLNHYFPEWNFSHPALGILASAAALTIIIAGKKEIPQNDSTGIIKGTRQETHKMGTGQEPYGQDSAGTSPYISLGQ
jgi:hypothetical protein